MIYVTKFNHNMASLSVASRHFPSIKELVYYFYIVLNCPNVESFCQLLSTLYFPTSNGKNVCRHYPYNDTIRSQSQQSSKPIHISIGSTKASTFCGEIVRLQKFPDHTVDLIMSC